jgi:predicted nucleotidyltransferase component of viral defense system
VIPAAYIAQWGAGAPWPQRQQIEQDLVLSRLIVAIANDPLLGEDLAFRGGTCLHKLHLPTALRYSQDLDYTRMSGGGIKEHLNALRDVTDAAGLVEKGTRRSGAMIHFHAEAPATDGGKKVITVEIRIDETTAYLPRERIHYEVRSRWYSGDADVSTFQIDELMGTKLRALRALEGA